MADIIRTSDGKEFCQATHGTLFEAVASNHQADINSNISKGSAPVDTSGRQSLNECLNQMIRDFNAGNWDAVIKEKFISDNISAHNVYNSALPYEKAEMVVIMVAVAYAKRDGNFEELNRLKYKKPYSVNEELYLSAVKLINYTPFSSPTTGKYSGYTKEDFKKLIATIKAGDMTKYKRLKALQELNAGTFKPEDYEEYYKKGLFGGLFKKK